MKFLKTISNPCIECELAFCCDYLRGQFNPKKACDKKLLYLNETRIKGD